MQVLQPAQQTAPPACGQGQIGSACRLLTRMKGQPGAFTCQRAWIAEAIGFSPPHGAPKAQLWAVPKSQCPVRIAIMGCAVVAPALKAIMTLICMSSLSVYMSCICWLRPDIQINQRRAWGTRVLSRILPFNLVQSWTTFSWLVAAIIDWASRILQLQLRGCMAGILGCQVQASDLTACLQLSADFGIDQGRWLVAMCQGRDKGQVVQG